MPKNEELRDEIANFLEDLDEQGLNKWARADAVIERLAAAWDDGETAGVSMTTANQTWDNPFRA